MSRSWAGGSTHRWRRLRAALLAANAAENAGRCTLHIPNICTGQATQIHHIRGKNAGDDPKWMIPVCKACNLHVGDPNKGRVEPKRVSRW